MFRSNPTKKMPEILIERTLEKAANTVNSTVKDLRDIPAGKKRKIHDDITVVVVDLEKQYKG